MFTVVKSRMNPCVARAVSIGLAMARFFGTSSPKIIVSVAPIASPRPMASGCMTSSGMPTASSGGEISSAIAGSARKPMARLVTVMPTWAPESCVDSERSAAQHADGPGVTLGGELLDAGPVDGDERELRRDEDAARDDEHQRDRQQDPGGHRSHQGAC